MKVIAHPWANGGDESSKPMVTQLDNGRWLIVADSDTDADGSIRVGQIDPISGQSETSLRKSNGWKGPNDNVDSEKIPFYVLPGNWEEVTTVKCKLGDMARLSYKDKFVYAIYADAGPRKIIGEASIFAIEALGGNPWNATKTKIVTGIPFGVSYEIIPNSSNLARTTSYETIQAYGKELFEGAKNPELPADFSDKFDHLKNVQADLLLGVDVSKLLWNWMQDHALSKEAFKALVKEGVKPEYGNAQCATTTASVLEGACNSAGLTDTAKIFSRANRDKDKFALTHQVEVMLKRLGFRMYDKKLYVAPIGAICLMKGRYNFAGCKQHSGHVYTMHTDKGPDQKDIINDNGGYEHLYANYTESFFLPRGIKAMKRGEPVEPKPEEPGEVAATWIELNRSDAGKPAATAYAGATPLYTRFWKDKKDLIDFLNEFSMAESVLVADTDKKAIPVKPDSTDIFPDEITHASQFVTYFKANYGLVRKEVERWFAPMNDGSATHNGCVAHQASCLKLCMIPHPEFDTLAAINVDYFVEWALKAGWKKITAMDAMEPGDICVSGPSVTDWDHVYCFVDYVDANNAHVLHNQATGLAVRSLAGVGCGRWRYALRMP